MVDTLASWKSVKGRSGSNPTSNNPVFLGRKDELMGWGTSLQTCCSGLGPPESIRGLTATRPCWCARPLSLGWAPASLSDAIDRI